MNSDVGLWTWELGLVRLDEFHSLRAGGQNFFHALGQFARAERFAKHRRDAPLFLQLLARQFQPLRRQHDYRHVACLRPAAQMSHEAQSIEAWHLAVGDNQVRHRGTGGSRADGRARDEPLTRK